MKKLLLLLLTIYSHCQCTNAQIVAGGIAGPNKNADIHIASKYVLGSQGDTVILRGVNYAPYNWGWSPSDIKINEIALSNANAVRLVWYVNGGGAPTYANWAALDTAISRCVQAGIVAIPELHDQTCNNDSAALVALSTWYTHPNFTQILNKYKGYVIINFANEALGSGAWSWLGGSTTVFTNTYKTIISNLRNANITCPIMIDAPDCGGNETALLSTANQLQLHDPLHSIIFSVHAYWPTPSNSASVLNTKINSLYNSAQPFILGEVANTNDCSDVILLDSLLKYATQKNIGWLAWSWDHDNCSSRQISTNGLFSNLTTYGNKIINNASYGMQAKAVKILPPLPSMPLSISDKLYAQISANKNTITISWNAIATSNNYIVQSSFDGTTFFDLQKTIQNKYTIASNLQSVYYRIIALNNNNIVEYSNTVHLQQSAADAFAFGPNPCNDVLLFVNNDSKILLYNLQGNLLETIEAYQKNITISHWTPGVYFLKHQNKIYQLIKN